MKNPKLNQFEKSLVGYLCSQSRIKSDQRVIIAVSGGKDSMVLLHSMNKTARRLNIAIDAVHVNHHLRDDSYEDQALVEKTCTKLKINLIIDHLDPATKLKGESLEMWARTHRYRSLERIRKEINADWIFTAHHGNDQIETILMHLDDGCGIEGLRGIPYQNGIIIRPLLKFSRNDIETYVQRHGLDYREDASNTDTSIRRNYVRHNVVKPWEDQSSGLVKRFNTLAEKATKAVQRMNVLIASIEEKIKAENGRVFIKDEIVKDFSFSQLARLIKHMMGEAETAWRAHKWTSLSQWLESAETGCKFKINDKWAILRDRDQWVMQNKTLGSDGFSLCLNAVNHPKISTDPWTEIIDGGAIHGKDIILRKWETGDRFQPLGMAGRKKVSDLLIDEKVDRFSKEDQMVVTADGEIIWVCGRRISDNVKVSEKTTDFMELSLVRELG